MTSLLEIYRQKYPEMFEDCFDFSIRDGWRTLLIDPYLELVTKEIARQQEYVELTKRYVESPPNDIWTPEKLLEEEGRLAAMLADRPRIHQIKEKFGGLRVYAAVGVRYKFMLHYMEALSWKICEGCGSTQNVGIDPARSWRKTYCVTCNAKRYTDGAFSE